MGKDKSEITRSVSGDRRCDLFAGIEGQCKRLRKGGTRGNEDEDEWEDELSAPAWLPFYTQSGGDEGLSDHDGQCPQVRGCPQAVGCPQDHNGNSAPVAVRIA